MAVSDMGSRNSLAVSRSASFGQFTFGALKKLQCVGAGLHFAQFVKKASGRSIRREQAGQDAPDGWRRRDLADEGRKDQSTRRPERRTGCRGRCARRRAPLPPVPWPKVGDADAGSPRPEPEPPSLPSSSRARIARCKACGS